MLKMQTTARPTRIQTQVWLLDEAPSATRLRNRRNERGVALGIFTPPRHGEWPAPSVQFLPPYVSRLARVSANSSPNVAAVPRATSCFFTVSAVAPLIIRATTQHARNGRTMLTRINFSREISRLYHNRCHIKCFIILLRTPLVLEKHVAATRVQ